MEGRQMTFEDLMPKQNDPLYERAKAAVIERGAASTGMFQRMFQIGFLRAERLLLQLEEEGVISKKIPGKPRRILTEEE